MGCMGETGRWGEETRCKEVVQVSAVVFKTEQGGGRTRRDWSTKNKVQTLMEGGVKAPKTSCDMFSFRSGKLYRAIYSQVV